MLIPSTELSDHLGEAVNLRGWLLSRQVRGGLAFLGLRDGEGRAQLVADRSTLGEEAFGRLVGLPLESPLVASGVVGRPGEGRQAELVLTGYRAEPSAPDYPIGRKEHGPDFLMDERHLWLRAPRQAAILRIRSTLEFACEHVLHREGFHRFDAPLLTGTACEGTTELFSVDYFGGRAYLSQSGQLYAEAGIAALGKVYTFGPCFRAEKSQTRRHLTEFWGVEPEMAYVDALGNMAFQERFLRLVLRAVAEERSGDLAELGRDPEDLLFGPEAFPVLTYDEALRRLDGLGRQRPWGTDLSVEDEEVLTRSFDTPIFIYRYPAACRPFYTEVDPERLDLALASDCLMPGGFGEIISGGQRAKDPEFLRARMKEAGLPEEPLSWYLDLRRYGSVLHSGFGMGIERMLRWICGLHHIRETLPFPRTPQRCSP